MFIDDVLDTPDWYAKFIARNAGLLGTDRLEECFGILKPCTRGKPAVLGVAPIGLVLLGVNGSRNESGKVVIDVAGVTVVGEFQ